MLARLGGLSVIVATVGLLDGACSRSAGVDDAGVVSDAGGCADRSPGCLQMGCVGPTGGHQVQFDIPIAAPMGDLPGSAVVGCRNGACVTGTLLTPAESPYHCNCVEFPADEVYLTAYVLDREDAGAPVLMAGWGSNFGRPGQLPDFQNGDRFSLEMTTLGGTVVGVASGVANYEVDYPNGPCCEPRCVYATVRTPPDAGAVH